MKIAVIILALLGALLSIGLGAKWLSDFNKYKSTIQSLQSLSDQSGGVASPELKKIESLKKAAYCLIIFGVLSAIAGIAVSKLGKISGLILILSAIVPAVFDASTLIVTFLLIIAGILALLVKPRTV